MQEQQYWSVISPSRDVSVRSITPVGFMAYDKTIEKFLNGLPNNWEFYAESGYLVKMVTINLI